MLFLISITEPPKVGQRKARIYRFAVLATSQAAAIPTFQLTHEHWMTPTSRIDVEPYEGAVISLG